MVTNDQTNNRVNLEQVCSWNIADFCKDKDKDRFMKRMLQPSSSWKLWPLRYWLHCRRSISKFIEISLKRDREQHSQFLQCFDTQLNSKSNEKEDLQDLFTLGNPGNRGWFCLYFAVRSKRAQKLFSLCNVFQRKILPTSPDVLLLKVCILC